MDYVTPPDCGSDGKNGTLQSSVWGWAAFGTRGSFAIDAASLFSNPDQSSRHLSPTLPGIKAIIGVTSVFHSKLFRRESPESAKLVSSYYQARGKQCQKRIVGAGRPVREATNIAANADAQLDGKEIDPAGRKRRGAVDQRKGTGPSMGDKSRLKNFTANCVCWGHTCAFEGSTWTGSEVARKGVGRADTTLLPMQMG